MLKHAILALCLLLSGCSNLDYLTKNTQPAQSANYIQFDQDAVYEVKKGVGVPWKEGVQKGLYRPELENEYGTFYRGPYECVVQFMGGKSMGPFNGGIWVPKDQVNRKPMIYYYFNYNHDDASKVGGALATTLFEMGKGDLTFIPPVDEDTFLNHIVIKNSPSQ